MILLVKDTEMHAALMTLSNPDTRGYGASGAAPAGATRRDMI
jgi:hypothetical protein